MSEEFGPDFITVTDEEGNEFELEHLDTLEYNGNVYMAFFPAVEGEENENGEEIFSTLDSEEEEQEVYEKFMERLFADEE